MDRGVFHAEAAIRFGRGRQILPSCRVLTSKDTQLTAEANNLRGEERRQFSLLYVRVQLADDEEPLRVDVQTDCLIDGTWPPDSEAQEALLRAAGVTSNRTDDVIREIFLHPRSVYGVNEVMRLLGISDRLFSKIVDDVELRRNKGRVPIGLMLKILEDVFGMQRIELRSAMILRFSSVHSAVMKRSRSMRHDTSSR